MLAAAHGLFFSFSIFFVPLLEEFGWSRALTAGALSVSTAVQGVLAPVAGAIVDRVGPRRVMLGGVVALGLSSMLTSTVAAPWQLYLTTGVIGALGITGVGWVPTSVMLSRWFRDRRGRAVGLAFSGMGMGVFVMGPLAQWVIGRVGWRFATFTLGVGTLVVLFPIVWLYARDAPPVDDRRHAESRSGVSARGGPRTAVADRDSTLRDALGSRTFWALFTAYFMTPLAVFPIVTHQVAFAVDLGFPRLFVASVFGLTGLMSSAGRVGFGLIADRLGGPMAATISFGCTAGGALALLGLEAVPFRPWLVVYALLFGLGFGARGPIITAMASELYGGRRFGLIYGLLNVGNGLGGAIGPWLGGFVHDVTGSYRIVFLASVVFCALGSSCFWVAARRRRIDA